MLIELPDHLVNEMGKTVFTGLVHVKDDGHIMVMVPVPGTEGDFSDEAPWIVETFASAEAISFGAELANKGAGGGTA